MSAYISPRWDHLRSYFFKIGLIMALIITIILFNWNFSHSEPTPFVIDHSELDVVVNIPRTAPEKKKEKVLVEKKLSPKKEIVKLDKIELVEDSPTPEKEETITTTDPEEPVYVSDSSSYTAPVVDLIPITTEEDDEPRRFAERMPIFGDCFSSESSEAKKCSDQALLAFVSKNLKYPVIARENGIQGTVVIKFVVDKKGQIKDIKIVKDIGANCGQAAVDVIEKMTDWLPGKQNGRPVSVYFTMPVRFSLR